MKTKDNIKNNAYFKLGSNGISLIVLIITIIVIIILATAIIVTILTNNPISEANKARFESDRDSMQAIFTNTVAKVMAKNQCTMDIKAGALNTVTSGVRSSTGEANYTLNNPINEGNINESIIFDNKENTGTEYYTGKQLPIYSSGETTWYVDKDGIISLKVGDDIYGKGDIEENINDNIKISVNTVINNEFSKATLKIVVEYDGELDRVIINGEVIEVVRNSDGKYLSNKVVNDNGIYNITAISKDGSLNKTFVKVDKLTENMEIWNSADMEKFRDKVNSGITFDGKKAIVMDNIDLENVEWKPIGSNGKNI